MNDQTKIKPEKIGKRDSWTCEFCGEPVQTWRNCRKPECIAKREGGAE